MKKRIILLLMFALALTGPGQLPAQVITTPDSVIWLSPYGPWTLCLSTNPSTVALATSAGYCSGVLPDTYLLLYQGPASDATWYQYTLTAIVAGSPSPVTLTGVWKRNDNAYGWSNTEVVIPGLVTSFTAEIQGLTLDKHSLQRH
jgi:hypothetical protein